MKRDRQARQIGLTSAKKVKRPSSKYYRGGTDGNKGKKKKSWYEWVCNKCLKRYKIELKSNCKCNCIN